MNDKKVIAAIIGRDEQMLAFVMRRYSRLLWKVAASVLINASSAGEVEECVADVFIYLWQHPEKYDSDKAKLSSWLSIIARSKAIDRYRRIMKRKEESMEEAAADVLGYCLPEIFDEEKEKLISCLERLGGKEKELIMRRYYHEQKLAEIALALNMSKKQVENRLYQLRQRLKKMMQNPEV